MCQPTPRKLAAAGLVMLAVVIAAPAEPPVQIVLEPHEQIVSQQQRKLHGRFLHITDFHPDPYYKVHTSTDGNSACHRGKGPAGYYGAETSDCDSPFSLVNATFDWLDANLRDSIDFIIWTGDSARHDSDEKIGRDEKQVEVLNRMVADKFVATFSDSHGLTIPVVPTFGNNDILPHNIMEPGPNKWTKKYVDIWKAFIPEEQRHSFQFGGWFYTEVIPNKLAVFSLNTLYFFERNAAVDDCVNPYEPGFKQMEWLRVQLQFLRRRGMKAIIIGHVPPARTSAKQLWDETCWQKYTLWLKQYRDVVVGSMFGHMNLDHFMIQDTNDINLALLRTGSSEYEEHQKQRKKRKHSLASSEESLSVQSSTDYLLELRDHWAKIPKVASQVSTENAAEGEKKKKKKHKGKKKKGDDQIGGEWAERYHMSLVGPSIVPNFFPTIRIIEYNITGLEDAPTWLDTMRTITEDSRAITPSIEEDEQKVHQELYRDISIEKKHGDKNKDGKGKKPKEDPKDPYLVIPDPPSKTDPPGPAYSPQPLTWTGFTQYFANLTYLNNDMGRDEQKLSASRWDSGMHGDKNGKKPNSKPRPLSFEFEVEYSTFDDKIYMLEDLTVRSFADLAYRIGHISTDSKALADVVPDLIGDDEEDLEGYLEEAEDEIEADEDSDEEDTEDEEEDVEPFGKKGKKGKKDRKKKKKKKHRKSKIWLHFLKHAFVSTVGVDNLKKLSD